MDFRLFNAILSMDSYNRGYGAGINGLSDGIGSQIGIAKIYDSHGGGDAQAIGFYAVAYDVGGAGKVISYRGTDEATGDIPFFYDAKSGSDIWHGWSIGAGNTQSEQAAMAYEFYHTVSGGIDPRNAAIITTGHSLGGGLAGLVAGAYGKEGILFDNMPFEYALALTRSHARDFDAGLKELVYQNKTPWNIDLARLESISLSGEVLEPSRLSQVGTRDTVYNIGANVVLPARAIALHSMSALVIRMFAETEIGDIKNWEHAARYFWPLLYDNNFAEILGLDVNTSVSGQSQTDKNYTSILQSIIAYSAIDQGMRVFGDTAIRALYDDANDLGRAIGPTGANQLVVRYAADISKIFVQYAGQLALSKVRQDANKVVDEQQGLLAYSSSNRPLVIDFDAAKLRAANPGDLPALHSDVLVDRIIASDVSTKPGFEAMLWSSVWEPFYQVGRIMFAPAVQALVTVAPFATPRDDVTIYVGANGVDRVLGSSGNDFLVGNAGNDVLSSGGGKDVIAGGAGFDTASFSGGPYPVYVNIRNADQGGYDVYRHIGSSNELIGIIYTSERIIGTSHIDVAEYGRSNSAVTVTPLAEASAGLRVQKTGGSIDTRNVEFVAFEGVDGSVYDDVMRGNNANNIFWGRVGNDRFLGSLGSDIFEGGGNTDTVNYSTLGISIDITTLNAAQGNYRVQKVVTGPDPIDRLFSIETLIGMKVPVFEAAGGRAITGTGAADSLSPYIVTGSIDGPFTFRGLGGDDMLSGSEANDRFVGGTGNDFLIGGRGNDIFEYNRGDGNDIIQVNGNGNDEFQSDQLVFGPGIRPSDVTLTRDASQGVTIHIAGSGTILLDGQLSFPLDFIRFVDKTVWNMETIQVPVTGTENADVINGVPEYFGLREGALVSDLIYGRGGNDSIDVANGENVVYGGLGNDWINGGIDRDKLFGETGNDFLAGGDQDDQLDGGANDDELRGESGSDRLLGQGGRDILLGGDGTDTLSGGSANDTLDGETGNDTLDGGSGNDALYGGAGSDRFVFGSNSDQDTISDFERAFDTIVLISLPAQVDTFSDLDITQNGANTIIALGGDDRIMLSNISRNSLTDSNFDIA